VLGRLPVRWSAVFYQCDRPVSSDAWRLWMGEAELRGLFDKDRNVVVDGTVVERTVFLGDDFLNCGALHMREALDQTVNDSHEGFGFLGHCKSFDPAISRVNGPYSRRPSWACEWPRYGAALRLAVRRGPSGGAFHGSGAVLA
jgi:hypothetical protein